MIVMTVILKMILLHLDNHKNALKNKRISKTIQKKYDR